MAVMTSPALEQVSLEVKASVVPADVMALEHEANGYHDVLFDESNLDPAPPADTQPQPTVNGNHDKSKATATEVELPAIVSTGAEGVSHLLPDSQTDVNSLFDGSQLGAPSIPSAVEAPISDVRDETPPAEFLTTTQATTESTQQVPETQIQPNDLEPADAMDMSQAADDAAGDSIAQSFEAPPTKPMTELSIQTQSDVASEQLPAQSPAIVDQEMEDAPPSGKVRAREDDDEGDVPEAKRTRTDEDMSVETEFKVPEVPAHTEQTNGNVSALAGESDQPSVQPAATAEEWSESALTNSQTKFLLERLRNTKKIKVAHAFKDPVDPVALNIPQYTDIVKKPMDLSTMEGKLKESKYAHVREFMEDLDTIIDNSILFNNRDHPVTQAGYNMRAYFLKGMNKMPRAGVEEPQKPPKPKKPQVATSTKPRRESRTSSITAKSPVAPPPSATSPQTTWPLNADGTPLIRRDSSTANDRPKREIHRPPPKDLPYTTMKPKKKKYQQELRFCESVMSEILKPKYEKFSWPFMNPVDPVALNIPSYLKIIKKPMDFGTVNKNLKEGQYQTAKDFHADAQLVFTNCFKFNPETDEVNRMGKQLSELFNSLWNEKSEWLAQHAPTSDPQSPGSNSSDEEEEEEEEEVDQTQDQILAIQKQIQALNETAQALLHKNGGKRASPKAGPKKKSGKAAPQKKKNSLAVPPPMKTSKPKARVRAPAPLTFGQKQEISEGISTLGDSDMRKAVQIIRNGCPQLASVNDDEMEIDMDEIDDNTLRELFKFIKSVRGPVRGAVADDDYDPPPTAHRANAKPKKNKPMGKKEQEDNIKRIQEQLRNFEASGASGSSQSPPANQDDSSDDESSGSESEEE
ncbi:Bromodomain-containing protein [Polyplosphaeria fusca]|uniref:Bromodomain-containing protein n=1 Tax=Polyplosphaeria fusca TaxID=682080 RepID=A0A9P4QUY5_9PLEO|nr:Bromodomain-containing protein [Polyplosphaeria fusca]